MTNTHHKSTIKETLQARLETPLSVVRRIEQILNIRFTLDVCASAGNSKANKYYSIRDDALSINWTLPDDKAGLTPAAWMNPPYSRSEKKCADDCKKQICKKRGHHVRRDIPGIKDWVIKASTQSLIQSIIVVGLLPDDRSTSWYREHVDGKAAYVLVPDKRISFIHPVTMKPIKGNSTSSIFAVWLPMQIGITQHITITL